MAVPKTYCTAEEVEKQVNLTGGPSAARVELIPQAILDAEGWIDDHCGRSFGTTSVVAREFRPERDCRTVLTGDVHEVTEVAVRRTRRDAYAALSPNDWAMIFPDGSNRPAEGVMTFDDADRLPLRPYPEDTVRVTGNFGWAEVPEPVHRVCIIVAAKYALAYSGPGHSTGAIEPSMPANFYGTGGKSVQDILSPYVRVVVA